MRTCIPKQRKDGIRQRYWVKNPLGKKVKKKPMVILTAPRQGWIQVTKFSGGS